MDSDVPVFNIKTMEEHIAVTVAAPRFNTTLLAIFAVVALILTIVGLYGVLSYSVSQRIHEIGIRAALGATQRDILRMVVGEGLLLTSIGLGIGILAALGLTRLLVSILYGIRPRDPLTFVGLSLMLACVSVLATYVPARRATKIDPMSAVRHE